MRPACIPLRPTVTRAGGASMAIQKFFVPGLSHDAEAEIEKSLRAVEGVLFAAAKHLDECAEVEFEDDCVTPDELREVLKELGYEAKLAG